jgi:dethiobiotin synthetase
VGKTLLTAHLLHHLRQAGVEALGMKPFCTGSRGDVHLLQEFQKGSLSVAEANPFYFERPLAPLVAARLDRRRPVELAEVLQSIRRVARKCERLLVEGAGGLLVPLGENYTFADVVDALRCEVIVVGRNRLGVINHTLLTVAALKCTKSKEAQVVLMDENPRDASEATNERVLSGWLAPVKVWKVPHLGAEASESVWVRKNHSKIEKMLARLLH